MARVIRTDVRLDTSLESLLEHARPNPGPRVLATLVATAGSTYRKPGARMLIMADGSYHGLLSGGCLEADLGLHARQVLASGVAQAVEYDMRGPDDMLFGIGAGCEGAMRILLEPAGPGTPAMDALTAAAGAARRGDAASLVAVHGASNLPLGTYASSAALPAELAVAAGQGLAEARSRDVRFDSCGGSGRAFVQFLAPPPHLLICGGGPDANPVVAAALGLGWRVSVVDHRPAYALADRFPGAWVRQADARDVCVAVDVARCHAVVVMSHHFASDVAYLRALAHAGNLGFIGLLGPRARRQRILAELTDVERSFAARIRGPVGIDIGAVTPEGIALAIVSQIHGWLAGRLDDSSCPFVPEA
jgi:xanthine/CO dehydrogenase XdhC/CoxF family maturation factor